MRKKREFEGKYQFLHWKSAKFEFPALHFPGVPTENNCMSVDFKKKCRKSRVETCTEWGTAFLPLTM